MDSRWTPLTPDSKRDLKVILHPTAFLNDVRTGAATDGVDITEFVSQGSHSQFQCSLTLNWNYELFGFSQPKPNQVVEIQLLQAGLYGLLWLGLIESINSFTLSRGARSMQLIAHSRDSLDNFRTTKRITELFPMMTDYAYIVQKVAKTTGLTEDEIVVPTSGFTTQTSNVQLADMSAWEMISTILLPIGYAPFIDGQGRLRLANRNLQGRVPDIVLEPERVVNVLANRHRPPATRVRVKWLDPVLKKSIQLERKLAEYAVTLGWFIPYWRQEVYFSDDWTQRAADTRPFAKQDVNAFIGADITTCIVKWTQTGENKGLLEFHNEITTVAVVAAIIAWNATHVIPDIAPPFGGPVAPTGRFQEGLAMLGVMFLMMSVGSGVYEIWGKPYEWIHVRNTSEAFDSDAPPGADSPQEIESDFVINEPHAQAFAIRELIYQARSANKWTVNIIDDPRLEFSDLLQFPDGTLMFVEDFQRKFGRGSEISLEVSGFLVNNAGAVKTALVTIGGVDNELPAPTPDPPSSPPGPTPNPPVPPGPTSPGLPGSSPDNPIIPMSADPAQIARDVRASLAFYGRTDDAYWIGVCGHVSKGFSDGLYRIGWSRYWEIKAAPGASDSAPIDTANQPAIHR